MILNKKDVQGLNTSILLSRGNKIQMEGITLKKFETETEEMTIQRLTYLGIHPIYNHETQALLWMPSSAC